MGRIWRRQGGRVLAGRSSLGRQALAAALLGVLAWSAGYLPGPVAGRAEALVSRAVGTDYDFAAAAARLARRGEAAARDLGVVPSSAPWRMIIPVDGVLYRPFGWWSGTGGPVLHRSILIRAKPGSAVRAAMAGRVGSAGAALVTVVRRGITTKYRGMAQVRVRAGQRVAQGQRLGILGAAGLRFEVQAGGHAVDPLQRRFFRGWSAAS